MNAPDANRMAVLIRALLTNDPNAPNASNTSFVVDVEDAGDSSAILIRNDVDQFQERFVTAGEVAEYVINHCWVRPIGCFHRVDQQIWQQGDDMDYLCVHCERKLMQRVLKESTVAFASVASTAKIHKADGDETLPD